MSDLLKILNGPIARELSRIVAEDIAAIQDSSDNDGREQ
jgi:hypothetical protein